MGAIVVPVFITEEPDLCKTKVSVCFQSPRRAGHHGVAVWNHVLIIRQSLGGGNQEAPSRAERHLLA